VRCRDFRQIADSYLSDELLTETNHEVINHLECCAECRRELAARRQLRFRLHATFAYADRLQIADEFANRLRGQLRALALRERKHSAPRLVAWLAIAVCLMLAVAVAFTLRSMRNHPSNQQRALAAGQPGSSENWGSGPGSSPGPPDEDSVLRATMAEISGDAAGDHHNCAINFRLLEPPIPLEEAGLKYDTAYLNLTGVVNNRLTQVSAGLQLVESHSCVFNSRRFAHIVLRDRGSLISLLVTDLSHPAGPGIAATRTLSERGQPAMISSQFEGYQIVCFETAKHAVFIVSDLAEAENLAVARLLGPSVYNHVTDAEGSA